MPCICTCILCIVFVYIMCVCAVFVVLGVRVLSGRRPCALYTEPVKRKIERMHARTGSASGVPGSEAGIMMHPVYVCACVQNARMHAHGVRRRCTVRANASWTHACVEDTFARGTCMYVRLSPGMPLADESFLGLRIGSMRFLARRRRTTFRSPPTS